MCVRGWRRGRRAAAVVAVVVLEVGVAGVRTSSLPDSDVVSAEPLWLCSSGGECRKEEEEEEKMKVRMRDDRNKQAELQIESSMDE